MTNKKKSSYVAKAVDKDGNAAYSLEENKIWQELIERQEPLITNRACDEFISGLKSLNLPSDKIPQCSDVSKVLFNKTGWMLEPVPALIPFDRFFSLLANKKFPAATFIRKREELDYLQEPDIFHEIFGHAPMLTNEACAAFTHAYGNLALNASHEDQVMLAKLYWFTIEFGLINTSKGIRAYGGGILSSKNETIYSVESDIPLRKPFDVMEVLRTPYRIDIIQPIYFVLENFDLLFNLMDMDLIGLIHEARSLGLYDPIYKRGEM